MKRPTIDLLCHLRYEAGQRLDKFARDGLEPLLEEIDEEIATLAARDGYLCSSCKQEVPHDSDHCPHCGAVDERPTDLSESETLESIASDLERRAGIYEGTAARYVSEGIEGAADGALVRSAKAHRRAAAIIRHQIECEA
jgi:hypothetical protein